MKSRRNFTPTFKKQVIAELTSGTSTSAQICRKYNICQSVLYRWKKQFNDGKLDNEVNQEAVLQSRIEDLERLAGKLALENDFLKKVLENATSRYRKRERLLPNSGENYPLKGGVR
jgi:transposase